MSNSQEDQEKPEANDEENQHAQIAGHERKVASEGRFWGYYSKQRFVIITSIIFTGWICAKFFVNMRSPWGVFLNFLYLPMWFPGQFIMGPLVWMHAPSIVMHASVIIYGLIASSLLGMLFSRRREPKGRFLPYFRLRILIMTSVIFIGWIYGTSTMTTAGPPNVGAGILQYLCFPMVMGYMLLVVLPFHLDHASSSVLNITSIVYGLIASYLVARLFYIGRHGKGRDIIVPQPKALDNPQSPEHKTKD